MKEILNVMNGRFGILWCVASLFLVMFSSEILSAENAGIVKPCEAESIQQKSKQSQMNNLSKTEIVKKCSKLLIPFIANRGQMDERVSFYANTFGGTVFVTKDGEIVYALPGSENKGDRNQEPRVNIQECNGELYSPNATSNVEFGTHDNSESCIKSCRLGEAERTQQINDLSPPTPKSRAMNLAASLQGVALKETLIGANVKEIKVEENAVTKVNYFKGSDQSKWKTGISTYDVVNLGEVYEGIGLRLKAYGDNVEKVFCVKPGASPERIRVQLSGAKAIKINKEGQLEIETGLGPVKFTKPVAYQEISGRRVEVTVEYELYASPLGIHCKDVKNAEEDIEGNTNKLCLSVLPSDAEGLGNIFFPLVGMNRVEKGFSYITDLQSTIAYQCNSTAPVNPNLQSKIQNPKFEYGFKVASYDRTKDLNIDPLLASTFLGGSDYDKGYFLTVNTGGDVYVTGSTRSTDFPTMSGAYDISFNGGDYDVFISKLNSELTSLLASTYLGGSSDDGGRSLVLDTSGNVYVTGYTWSIGFPTTSGAYDTSFNSDYEGDVFISKLNSELTSLLASTYLGGSHDDYGESLTLDTSGNIYVTGNTTSSNFPTTSGAYDTSFNGGSYDTFISKLNDGLTSILASTYLGGSSHDGGKSLVLDTSGNVYVTGFTYSTNFPTTNGAYDTSNGGKSDAFVSKLNSGLTSLLASTYLGGSHDDYGESLTLDTSGNIYVTGNTTSSNFPTTSGAYDTSFNGGSYDAFISKLNGGLTSLLASTYLGGSNSDEGYSLVLDTIGNVYVTGYTYSSGFPTTSGAYDTSYNYDTYYGEDPDIFISKLNSGLTSLLASTYLGGVRDDIGYSLALDTSGNVFVTGYTYSRKDFPTTKGAYDTSWNEAYDAFVSKLDSELSASAGTTTVWTWTIETVDDSGWIGRDTSIAIDSSNKVHISYLDYSNNTLKYANNTSGSWAIKTVDNSKNVGYYTSIALDSSNKAHISYTGSGINYLRYATNKEGSWSTKIIDDSEGVGKYTSIAIDSSDQVHISYNDYDNNDLKYATYANGLWKISTVDSLGWVGEWSSIALDKSDVAHISYQDYTKGYLKYATNASGSWKTSTVYNVGFGYFGMYTSIAIDGASKVHISFYGAYGSLKYATNASGSWVTTTVDSGGSDGSGTYTSIALDASGKVHISYYDDYNTSLKYATNASGSWVTTTVDNSGDVGKYTSIAVDKSGKVHISYHDSTNQTLKYATNADQSPIPASSPSPSPTPTSTSTPPTTGHTAALYVSPSEISINDSVLVTVVDWDLNTSSSYADTGSVKIKSNTDTTGIYLTVTETRVNSGTFRGSLRTAYTTNSSASQIGVNTSDTVTISYYDELDANGNSTTVTTTVSVTGEVVPTPGESPTPVQTPTLPAVLTGSIEVSVVDAVSSNPIAGATLVLSPDDILGTTDTTGSYTFNELSAGDYVVIAVANGYDPSNPIPVTVTEGESTLVSISLQPISTTPVIIDADVSIRPKTINLNSRRNFMAFIELPSPYNVEDINMDTVECNGAKAISAKVDFWDRYIATFKISDLRSKNYRKGKTQFTVSGELADGTRFEGSGDVKIKK